MDLPELFSRLKHAWAPVLVFIAVGAAVSFGLTASQPKSYSASSTILLQPVGGTSDLNSGATFVERVATTYAALVGTALVQDPLASAMGVSSSEIRGHLSATVVPGTTFLKVTATWTDPARAAALADKAAVALSGAIDQVAPKVNGKPSIAVSTTAKAVVPTQASAPDVPMSTLLGALIGMVVGLGFILLRSALDSRVRTAPQLFKVTSVPVLATIRSVKEGDPEIMADDFRRVRSSLRLFDRARRPRTIVLTSTSGAEGRATVSYQLAQTAREGGLKVCLVETDLRDRGLTAAIALPRVAGLAEVLAGDVEVRDVVIDVHGVDVLTGGSDLGNSAELAGSPETAMLMRRLQDTYDLVIADGGPLESAVDAAVLGALVDAVVLVVGRAKVTVAELEASVGTLRLAGADLAGTVFNEVTGPSVESSKVARHHRPPAATVTWPPVH